MRRRLGLALYLSRVRSSDVLGGMWNPNLILVPLNVCEQALINALVVRIVARVTLSKLTQGLARKFGSDSFDGIGVKPRRQPQDCNSVGRNSRHFRTANKLKSAHKELSGFSRRIEEELSIPSVVHFALHRLDREYDTFWFSKGRVGFVEQCLFDSENKRINPVTGLHGNQLLKGLATVSVEEWFVHSGCGGQCRLTVELSGAHADV